MGNSLKFNFSFVHLLEMGNNIPGVDMTVLILDLIHWALAPNSHLPLKFC